MKVARVEDALVVSSFIAVEDGTNKENLQYTKLSQKHSSHHGFKLTVSYCKHTYLYCLFLLLSIIHNHDN